jgi:hypothetical protein
MNDSEKRKVETLMKDIENIAENQDPRNWTGTHFNFPPSLMAMMERYAHAHKLNMQDVAITGVWFYFQYKNVRLDRDDSFHLVVTACEEQCFKCGGKIEAGILVQNNKRLGYFCENCDPTLADKRILRKMQINRELDRKHEVLEAKVNDEALTLEAIDNEKTIYRLLVEEESMDKIAKKLNDFLDNWGNLPESDATTTLKGLVTELNQRKKRMIESNQIRKVLVEKYSDAILLAQRRKRMQEASVQRVNAKTVQLEESESLTTENR